ncbi:MAG: SpoIIE family protein phosphatase [Deltaproteobacteria bacterium]|nr:SpoIIE family protein phosphatase [Deltaproteobacteria bacterium]
MIVRPRSSIGLKITMLVLCGTSVVFAMALAYSYSYSRTIILDEAEKNARNLTLSVARRIEQEFRVVEKLPEHLCAFLEAGPFDKDTLLRLVRRLVEENREVFGSAVAFEPNSFQPGVRWYAPYYFKGKSGITFEQIGSDSYDYFTKDWYHLPKVLKAPVWMNPYFDEGGGGIIMTTYSCPFFERGRDGAPDKIRGIVTADVSLEWLSSLVRSIQVGRTGYCFIISDTGTFVTHHNPELIMSESIFSLAEEHHNPALRDIGLAMIRDESGFTPIGSVLWPEDAFLAYARIPSPGWTLGWVFPKRELLARVNNLHRTTVLLAAGGLVLLIAVSLLTARSITQPLIRMAAATGKVAHGDLDIDLSDIHREDEVGQLARSFMGMARDLKKHIRDLTNATAAKQRIDSELSIAADIQRSMLPSVFPAFPSRNEFDIYAVMHPAKEVGGDFYDFFLLDEDHLCVVIGDVSGKGVPAALFMSVTKYLIQAALGAGELPGGVSARVNRHLAVNNESCMFVTVFLGILNLKTGEFLYANAGHNPPLLWDSTSTAGFLGPPGGPLLGIIEDATFDMDRLTFSPGTVLLAYTDGVTEAFDSEGKLFSEERLIEVITSVGQKTVKEITEVLLEKIASFRKGAAQSDDITIMALQFGSRPSSD